MAKQLTFEFEGKEYTLEFTRKSIETMERQGFVASDVESKPMTTLPALFAGAFIARHRHLKKDTIDRMFDQAPSKQELIGALAEMFSEPYEALFDDDGEEKNAVWAKNF